MTYQAMNKIIGSLDFVRTQITSFANKKLVGPGEMGADHKYHILNVVPTDLSYVDCQQLGGLKWQALQMFVTHWVDLRRK